MMGGALALLLLALSATRAAAAPLAIDGQKIVDQVWCCVHVQQNCQKVCFTSRPPWSWPMRQLTKLATFTDHPNPAVTRILFTPNDMLGRRYTI